MTDSTFELTLQQRRRLEDIWFVFGNHGKKHTMANHKTIQSLLEKGKDYSSFYGPTQECSDAIREIMEQS